MSSASFHPRPSAFTSILISLALAPTIAACAVTSTPVPTSVITPRPITTPPSVIEAGGSPTPEPTAMPRALPTETPRPMFLQQHILNLFDLARLPVMEHTIATQFTSRNWVSREHYFDYFIDDGNFVGPNYGYDDESGNRQPYRIVQGYDGAREYEVVPRVQGPGYIARIWFAYQQHQSLNNPKDMSQEVEWNNWGNLGEMGNVRFYFDDESTPRIDIGIKDLFVGKNPFPAPVAAFYASANGGNINYIPIPFERSIRLTTTGRPRLMQIEVKRLTAGVVQTLSSAAGASASDVPRPDSPNTLQSFSLDLAPNERAALDQASQAWQTCTPVQSGEYQSYAFSIGRDAATEVDFNRPATIAGLRVRVPRGRDESVWLQVFWDGETEPRINAPLRALFGTAERLLPYRALPMGIVANGPELVFYNNLPMPFQSARFVFLNHSDDPMPLTFEALPRETTPETENMRLHAFFGRRQVIRREDDGDNYVVIDAKGSGKYLGAIFSAWDLNRQALNGPLDDHWRFPYLESNLDVWVDGRMALPGTGIEDDFNAGYYYVYAGYPGYNSAYCLAGLTLLDYNSQTEPSSQYRFYLNDAPEFRNHLRVEVQHGNKGNNLTVIYSSTAFWYQIK